VEELALWAGKLFHIDLNAQRMSRFDQDLRFGQEDIKEAFLLVRLLETSGYAGPRHFDAHALRVEDQDGVAEFARGCMRTYLILAEKALEFDSDPRVAEALAAAQVPALAAATIGPYTPEAAYALSQEAFALDALAARGAGHERIDQLVVERLLGV
jgi:xylose isomerase